MEIKKLAKNVLNFSLNRFIEILGISVVIVGLLLLISLISYSPDDPNFIFPDNTEIKNFLGYRGSFVSDLFFQSFGFIVFLIPFSFIFSGLNIFLNKRILLIVESLFYTCLYSIFGCLFFSTFYTNAFKLYINGNGGFVGNYLETTFLDSLINVNIQISYYSLIIIILTLFLVSIQFNIKFFYKFIKDIINILFFKNKKNYTNENEVINEFIPQDEIKNLIQEDLPFIKTKTNDNKDTSKFKLPSFNLLKNSSKNEKEKLSDDNYVDSKFLEKILLDFGGMHWPISNGSKP